MARIQILSDLHLESPKAYDSFQIIPKAPYLALLGDIGQIVPHREECLDFLERQLQQIQAVLFVPGKHEAYGSTWNGALSVLEAFEHDVAQRRERDKLGQFVLLSRGVFNIPSDDGSSVTILGCSLFSSVPLSTATAMAVELGLADFFRTTGWTARTHNEAHERDFAWPNEQVNTIEQTASNTRIAIFTHWSPTRDPRGSGPRHSNSAKSAGFATDLSDHVCFNSKNVRFWAFGHTHFNCDLLAERKAAATLKLVTNQRGYYFSQAPGFDGEKVFVV